MLRNEEEQDHDLERGLLDDACDSKSPPSSKPQNTAIPLKTLGVKTEADHIEQERVPLTSTEFPEDESDEIENEILEDRKILDNLMEYRTKIRTFFNAVGALKTGSVSRPITTADSMRHERYQPKWTALHHASAKGLCTLIRDLIDSGNDPNVTDDRGRTALDVAGIAFYQGFHIDSLSEVLKILLERNGKFNTMKGKIDSLDTPIHTAVELGCQESIKLLLNAGASVSCLNSSGLTPLHLCINKKQEESLKILLTYNSNNSDTVSERANTRNHAGFTLLQAAVVTDWVQGVNVLLDYEADVTGTSNLPFDRYNSVTVEDFTNLMYRLEQLHETPVHLAADVGNQQILRKLLNKKRSVVNNYNLIGQAPLYIAIRSGHLECVETLLNMGANAMRATNENQNALHIAIKFDQMKIFEFLLDYNDMANDMITSFDNHGYAPIHTATMCNRVDCIELLAKKNAYLRMLTKGDLITDWTPLHIAAAKNYPKAAEVLLKYDKKAIDDVDPKERSPIHIATARRNREVMAMILRKGAVLSSRTKTEKPKSCRKNKKATALKMISRELPNPTPFFEEVFDSFIEPNINTDGGRLIRMDYGVFTKVNEISQIKVLKDLVKCGQQKLLIHPLVESLIYLKWKSLLPFFCVIVGIYSFFALTMYAVIIGDFYDENRTDKYNYSNYLVAPLIIVVMLEVFYINVHRGRYFCQLENWTKLVSAGLAIVLLSTGHTSWTNAEWSRHVASAALLLSWAQIMFLISRFPNFGFYVLMFGKVSFNIFKIFLTFSFLVFAFALCFMIQYHSKSPFDGPWAAAIKTIVMMTSEFEYENLFGKDHKTELTNSKPIVNLIFVLFLIFVSIVFVNFMVGVAVSDVNDLKIEGNIRRLEKQVEFLSTLDVLAFGFGFRKLLSKDFISKRFVNSMKIKAGVTKKWMVCYEVKTNDDITMFEKEISLPSHILDNIFHKIQSKKEQKKEDKEVNLFREQVHFIYNFVTGFIDRFLTNEEPKRETKFDETLHCLNVQNSLVGPKRKTDNISNHTYYFKNQSTQTELTKIRNRGPRWLGLRSYFIKRSFWSKRTNKRERLVRELKSKVIEEATALRESQRKMFKKLQRMLKKL